jgi:hypothetical protein
MADRCPLAGTTGARAIFEYRLSQTALCTHGDSAQRRDASKKVWSKRYLGRWAFMATGPIEQVRRRGYIHIKRRGKRFHYSFVYGINCDSGTALRKEFCKNKAITKKVEVNRQRKLIVLWKMKDYCSFFVRVKGVIKIDRFSRIKFTPFTIIITK